MRVVLDSVAKGRGDQALSPTSCRIETGFATVVPVDNERGPSVLSLIMAGRMRPSRGTVTCNGHRDYRHLRAGFAMVDTPAVCEPAPGVPLRAVVAEELMYAQTFADPISTEGWLRDHGLRQYAGTSMAMLPGMVRVQTLTELALARPNIELAVITSPDRHGLDMAELAQYVDEVLRRGYGIALVLGQTTAPLAIDALRELGARVHENSELQDDESELHEDESEPQTDDPEATELHGSHAFLLDFDNSAID